MSRESFDRQRFLEIQTLRTQLTDDMFTLVRSDNANIGVILAWVGRNLELEQLEHLVDDVDALYRPAGRSVLGRKVTERDDQS